MKPRAASAAVQQRSELCQAVLDDDAARIEILVAKVGLKGAFHCTSTVLFTGQEANRGLH